MSSDKREISAPTNVLSNIPDNKKSTHFDEPTNFDKFPWLTYRSDAIEDEYLQFHHSAPRIGALIGTIATIPGIALPLLWNPDWDSSASIYGLVIFAVIQGAMVALFYLVPSQQARFLQAERVLLTVATFVAFSSYALFHLRQAERCKTQTLYYALDTRKVFDFARCYRYISPFGAAPLCYALFYRIPMFRYFAVLAYLNVMVNALIMLNPGTRPPDVQLMATLILVFNISAGLVLCVIRYDHEATERRQFEVYHGLTTQRKRLDTERKETMALCNAILPPSLVARIQRKDLFTEDHSNDAVIVVAGFADFSRWCIDNRPMDVAAKVTHFHDEVDKLWHEYQMDRVARLGDSVVGVGNLLQELQDAANVAGYVAVKLVELARKYSKIRHLPIHSFVHQGRLRGQLVGGQHLRYDVSGEALQLALASLSAIPAHEVWASATATGAMMTMRDEGDTVMASETPEEIVGGLRASRLLLSAFDAPPTFRDDALEISAPDTLAFVALLRLGQSGHNTPAPTTNGSLSALQQSGANTGSARPSAGSLEAESNETGDQDNPYRMKRYALFFLIFGDPETETKYIREREEKLPLAAARSWLAYGVFAVIILVLMLVDFPSGTVMTDGRVDIAVVLFVTTSLASFAMATWPRMVSVETRCEYFFAWSICGTIVPLLLVFAAALTRPSAVGVDVRAYMIVGALVRSYSFVTSRGHVVAIPLTLGLGTLHLLLPGSQLWTSNVLIFYFMVMVTAIVERFREGEERESFRREHTTRQVVRRTEAAVTAQRRLLRSSLPKPAFERVTAAPKLQETRANTNNAVVMLVRPRSGIAPSTQTSLLSSRADVPNVVPTSKSESRHDSVVVVSVNTQVINSNHTVIVELVDGCTHIHIVSIFGEDVVVAGPVDVGAGANNENDAMREAIGLAVAIGVGDKGAAPVSDTGASNRPSSVLQQDDAFVSFSAMSGETPGNSGMREEAVSIPYEPLSVVDAGESSQRSLSPHSQSVLSKGGKDDALADVLLEFDMGVHVLSPHPLPRYNFLGVGLTRIQAIAHGTQRGSLSGVLATDRVVALAGTLGAMKDISAELQPPMKIRGVGMLRLQRLTLI